jgi:DNA-binding NarL/FixJ family response regulator
LAGAIRALAAGRQYIHSAVTRALLERMGARLAVTDSRAALSPREMDVLRLMATPATYREIGGQLFISEETVRSHVKGILAKLHQPNRTQAVVAAVKMGLITLD